jgi:arylsulfatase A
LLLLKETVTSFRVTCVIFAVLISGHAFADGSAALLDIRPGNPANSVDTKTGSKSIHVAILNTETSDGDAFNFDTTEVDLATVRFGVGLASPDPNFLPDAIRDVDGDGDADLDLVFPVQEAGIVCDDTTATLTGRMTGGIEFSGNGAIAASDCPGCHNLKDSQREADDEIFHLTEDGELLVQDPVSTGQAFSSTPPTDGVLTLLTDGSFIYRPEADFSGRDVFSYWDGIDFRSVTLSVYPVNDKPVAIADAVSVAVGVTAVRSAPGVLINDMDIDGDALTATLVDDVSKGVLTLEQDGAFEYTPDALFAGHDSFSYQVTDGVVESDPIEVTIGYPNVLLIMADDIGQGDAQVYNPGSGIGLPSIEYLAATGMRFDYAHSSTPVCSPTRYSLLTGNHPYRSARSNGVWATIDDDTMLIPGEHTLGHVMADAGYRTAFIGKVHNGAAFWKTDGSGYVELFSEIDFIRPFDKGPTQFGFDYSFILPAGVSRGPYAFFENDRLVRYDGIVNDFLPFEDNAVAHSHFLPVVTGQAYNGGLIGSGGVAMDNYDSRQVGPTLTSQAIGFVDDHLTANAASSVDSPFFLYVALPAAHKPHTPPPVFNVDDPVAVDDVANGVPVANVTPVSNRTDMVYETDVALDALLGKLEEEGLLANTLIIYTSDNGMSELAPAGYTGIGERIDIGRDGAQHINAQGVENGVPLRGFKSLVFEGGHRVPFIARWGDGTPGSSVIDPGSVSSELIGLHDVMATFADMTGQNLEVDQARDSISFIKALSGEQAAGVPIRDHLIVQGTTSSAYYETGSFNFVDRAFYQRDSNGDQWKLVILSGWNNHQFNVQASKLFNLTVDPGETNDLFAESDAQGQLASMLTDYLQLISQNRTAD